MSTPEKLEICLILLTWFWLFRVIKVIKIRSKAINIVDKLCDKAIFAVAESNDKKFFIKYNGEWKKYFEYYNSWTITQMCFVVSLWSVKDFYPKFFTEKDEIVTFWDELECIKRQQ